MMVRMFRIFIICTLVMGTMLVMNNDRIGMSFVESAKAELTWDQLNQTIGELKDYIDNKFDAFISQTSEELEYIMARLNETDYNITLDVNESDVINRLINIQDMLGYEGDASVYEDIEAIMRGLIDSDGKYILRDTEGNSILKYVIFNQVNLSENQQMIVEKIALEGNGTRNYMDGVGADVNKYTKKQTQSINSDGLIATIIFIEVSFLLAWIFYIKPKYFSRARYETEYETDDAPEIPPNRQSQPTGLTNFPSTQRANPLSLHTGAGKKGPPPDCFKDGVSYDPVVELACGNCIYAQECQQVKMRVEAREEMELEREREKQMQNTSPASITGEIGQPEFNIDRW